MSLYQWCYINCCWSCLMLFNIACTQSQGLLSLRLLELQNMLWNLYNSPSTSSYIKESNTSSCFITTMFNVVYLELHTSIVFCVLYSVLVYFYNIYIECLSMCRCAVFLHIQVLQSCRIQKQHINWQLLHTIHLPNYT